jgi:hypothetical protein
MGSDEVLYKGMGQHSTQTVDENYLVQILITPWSRVFLEMRIVHSANREILRLLWKLEDSLPCSQQPVTDPCPEPDESNP